MDKLPIWFTKWLSKRAELPAKSVIVTDFLTFRDMADATTEDDDIAYISICDTFYIEDDEKWMNVHYLPSSPDVLNLDFDDVSEDCEILCDDGKRLIDIKAITREQGQKIADFVDSLNGKHIIVHCHAGVSRSQGVAKAIWAERFDVYSPNEFNEFNPCLTPNYRVVAEVRRGFRMRDMK